MFKKGMQLNFIPLSQVSNRVCLLVFRSTLARESSRVREMIAQGMMLLDRVRSSEFGANLGELVDGGSGVFLRLNKTTELVYESDGDSNGVFHYLGTCYGTQPFVNPALVGRMKVGCSGGHGRGVEPRDIIGSKYVRCCFASASVENATWWSLDLRQHRLACNYYSIRHDDSDNFVRSWNLEGSEDGIEWTILRRHEQVCQYMRIL